MIIRKKRLGLISCFLAITCGIAYGFSNKTAKDVNVQSQELVTRTFELEDNSVDFDDALSEFEDSNLKTNGTLTTFEGYKTFDLSDYSEVDLVSETTVSDASVKVKFCFSYDSEFGNVSISANSTDNSETVELDKICGFAFYNEKGEIDACLDVEGEIVLLSEMQNLGMIENCGLFKKLLAAAAAVVTVAAVAAVCVATCGAGLGAVIAAGAIAGGITGGVAGGIISYSEYGKLDWKWVAGGVVIGAALGTATVWGVGTAMGCTNGSASYLSKNFKFSNTVTNHLAERPYSNSQLLAKEIMKSATPVADPGGIAGGLKWVVPGSFNGTLGTWELVYDTVNNLIVHFLFMA